MRKLVYSVAMSLDGYIAGLKGESDWIVIDPEIDFNAIFARFDTILRLENVRDHPAPARRRDACVKSHVPSRPRSKPTAEASRLRRSVGDGSGPEGAAARTSGLGAAGSSAACSNSAWSTRSTSL